MKEFFLGILSSVISGVLVCFIVEGIKKIFPKVKDFIKKNDILAIPYDWLFL